MVWPSLCANLQLILGNNCPNNVLLPIYNCTTDPCDKATCTDPYATCISNHCGGCNAVFWDRVGQNKAKCSGMYGIV